MLSVWLFHELTKRRVPIFCIDARHAKAALSLQINKTDANDAQGIAQVVRVGWYRQVLVKSMDTYAIRAMISARAQLVTTALKIKNTVRGLLKTFGLILKIGSQRRYIQIARSAIQDNPVLDHCRTNADSSRYPAGANRSLRPRALPAGIGRPDRQASHDCPRRRRHCCAFLHKHGRGSTPVQALANRRCVCRADSSEVPVG
jgi:hypothetical protein